MEPSAGTFRGIIIPSKITFPGNLPREPSLVESTRQFQNGREIFRETFRRTFRGNLPRNLPRKPSAETDSQKNSFIGKTIWNLPRKPSAGTFRGIHIPSKITFRGNLPREPSAEPSAETFIGVSRHHRTNRIPQAAEGSAEGFAECFCGTFCGR